MTTPALVVGEFECVGVHGPPGETFHFSRVYPYTPEHDGDERDDLRWHRCPVCNCNRRPHRERLALSPAAAGDLIRDVAFSLRDAVRPIVTASAPDLFSYRRGERPEPGGFVECAACAEKPGTPILCYSCLHNRGLIEQLRRIVREPTPTIEALADALMARLGGSAR